MADTIKKYLDLAGLQSYDAKIKAEIDKKDATILADGKAYADGLATNYDPAGSAATAKTEANAYTDGKIATVNTAVSKAQTQADKGVADAQKAQTAADTAKASADKAQSEVDALELYVGTIPTESQAKDVIAYIKEKTTGIATDTALSELQAQVNTNKGDIATIKGDYLKATDKTALQDSIKTVDDKVGVLNGTGVGSVKKQVDDALNDFATKVSNDNVVNTYKELVDYCATHSSEAASMAGDIAKNAQAIAKLETFVGKLPEGTQAKDVIAYINEKVDAEKSRATGVESGLDTRLKAVEGKLGSGVGSVTELIATAKQEAIDASAADATTKANNAKTGAVADAKTYTDTEVGKVKSTADANASAITAIQGKVQTLEGSSHAHTNKETLDTLTPTKIASIDAAVAKAHEHTNKVALDKVTDVKITKWDTAETNAKSYADGLFGKFTAITTKEIEDLFTPTVIA